MQSSQLPPTPTHTPTCIIFFRPFRFSLPPLLVEPSYEDGTITSRQARSQIWTKLIVRSYCSVKQIPQRAETLTGAHASVRLPPRGITGLISQRGSLSLSLAPVLFPRGQQHFKELLFIICLSAPQPILPTNVSHGILVPVPHAELREESGCCSLRYDLSLEVQLSFLSLKPRFGGRSALEVTNPRWCNAALQL